MIIFGNTETAEAKTFDESSDQPPSQLRKKGGDYLPDFGRVSGSLGGFAGSCLSFISFLSVGMTAFAQSSAPAGLG